mmetsp:Transcript_22171/g.40786  ORF Transcript_22171/g.40786 Transcript_22171/m.40786 type:complete len:313 (+) Transcript_22171:83-1021(+)
MAEATTIGAPTQDAMKETSATNGSTEQPKEVPTVQATVVAPPAAAPGQQSMNRPLRILTDETLMYFLGRFWMQVAQPHTGLWDLNYKEYTADAQNNLILTRTDQKTTCFCCTTAPSFSYAGMVQGQAFSGTASFYPEPKECCSGGHRPAYKAMSILTKNNDEWYVEMPEIQGDMTSCITGCCCVPGAENMLPCLCCLCICCASCCQQRLHKYEPTVETRDLKLKGPNGREATIQWAYHFGKLVNVSIDAGSPEDNLSLVILPWLVHSFVETEGKKEAGGWGMAATRVLSSLPFSAMHSMSANEYLASNLNRL